MLSSFQGLITFLTLLCSQQSGLSHAEDAPCEDTEEPASLLQGHHRRQLTSWGSSSTNCDWVDGTKAKWFNVSDITGNGPLFIGKDPLPARIQGVFWFKDDGGDALVSYGAGPNTSDSSSCSNGLLKKNGDKWCTSISTIRPGGWTFQAEATPPGTYGGPFPSVPDKLYYDCSMRWDMCFDSDTEPSFQSSTPHPMSWCVNLMLPSVTTSTYWGAPAKYGGHVWNVSTSFFGVIDSEDLSVPGDFLMIQVMDATGTKIQPAWDMFESQNSQIVYYELP
eukprot:TRINITY_DN49979_c0_g1_i1.p1 TRINITY_DN49979_c0_g1~~TRINITY_DN49979_c0_g1_i1.p1  ORF type:complete len:295 (-),score=35.60 TRINITY_DN49979_c0_g1_i1:390-1223(-)